LSLLSSQTHEFVGTLRLVTENAASGKAAALRLRALLSQSAAPVRLMLVAVENVCADHLGHIVLVAVTPDCAHVYDNAKTILPKVVSDLFSSRRTVAHQVVKQRGTECESLAVFCASAIVKGNNLALESEPYNVVLAKASNVMNKLCILASRIVKSETLPLDLRAAMRIDKRFRDEAYRP